MNTNIHQPNYTNICTLEWTMSIKTIQACVSNPFCWGALPKLLCAPLPPQPTSMHVQQKAFWENLCVMEGYCGRQWRQYRVAMEIWAGKTENCPLYLHHPHCSSIACCQGVGQSEKSVNVCEVDAKKCCWALCENLSKEKKCCVCVSESLGLYVGWRCEVVQADKKCSPFSCLLLTTFMTHFRPWQVHMCVFTSVCVTVCSMVCLSRRAGEQSNLRIQEMSPKWSFGFVMYYRRQFIIINNVKLFHWRLNL